MKNYKNISIFLLGVLAFATVMTLPEVAYAATTGAQVETKLTNAANIVKGILTGLIVLVGVIVALFIIIKRMPSMDDPHEKNEVFKSVGRVAAAVALGAAIVWILPWVYGLFT